MLAEAFREVFLALLDHLDLFLVHIPGFDPLFLLQVSVLVLGFDSFPLHLVPVLATTRILLSLRQDPAMFFPFLSWADISHTTQRFYPHADQLFGLIRYGLSLDCFFSFSPPPTPHSPTLNGKLFPYCLLLFPSAMAIVCHTEPLSYLRLV